MIFHRFDGIVLDRGDYWVVKTLHPTPASSKPLLFFKAPQKDSLAEWKEIFQKGICNQPRRETLHFPMEFAQEGIGDVTELDHAGFKINHSVVLTAKSVHLPKKPNQEIEIRPLRHRCGMARSDRTPRSSPRSQSMRRRITVLSRKSSSTATAPWWIKTWDLGLARFWMTPAADLGIFKTRMSAVSSPSKLTPAFSARGICGTLVHHTANYAFRKMGITELVMVADENYHTGKIYNPSCLKGILRILVGQIKNRCSPHPSCPKKF